MTEQQSGRSKPAELRAILVKQDVRSIRGSLGRFLLGLGWCFLAVFILATVIALLLNTLFGSSGLGWRGWFAVFFVGMAALLGWLYIRQRARGAVVAASPDSAPIRGFEAFLSPDVGKRIPRIVWGPPALLTGLRGLLGMRTRREEAVFDRAVVLVFDLAKEPGSIGVKAVVHSPEDMNIFGAAVDWLEANDWIGQSTDGSSVFISTLGQQRLVERNLKG
jgi:hypothetical protein